MFGSRIDSSSDFDKGADFEDLVGGKPEESAGVGGTPVEQDREGEQRGHQNDHPAARSNSKPHSSSVSARKLSSGVATSVRQVTKRPDWK